MSVERLSPERLYQQEIMYVWNLLLRLGASSRDVEDLCQEVFGAAVASLKRFDPSRPVRPWLVGIAMNVMNNERRRALRRLCIQVQLADDEPSYEIEPAHEARVLVQRALEQMSPDHRAVFVLCELEEYNSLEIAEILNIPLNTVYSRLARARVSFAEAISRVSLRETGS